MQVFHRVGSVVHINFRVALLNVVFLYGFFFITDEVIRQLGTYKRGMFCVDQSIHLPYKKSTVSSLQHRVYNISLMVISVFVVEAFRQFFRAPSDLSLRYRIGDLDIPRYAVYVLTFVGYSQVGYILNELLVKFVKGFIGRLRPNFYQVCNPLPIAECATLDPNAYVTEYTCSGDPHKVAESRKSFYSGHSTVTMYCAFWTVLYLQARLKPALRNNVVVGILQLLLMTGGLYICCSRISDNQHHWSDVFVGILVGMGFASVASVWWGKLFKDEEIGECDGVESSNGKSSEESV